MELTTTLSNVRQFLKPSTAAVDGIAIHELGAKKELEAVPVDGRADQHPPAVYLASLGRGSRRTMRQALGTIAALVSRGEFTADSLPWAELRYQHTAAVRSALAEGYAPATCNKYLAALRGVLRECWKLGQMDAEAYHRAVDLPSITLEQSPRGRTLSADEIRALFGACAADQSPSGVRDAAIFSLLYGAGLRRSEIVALDVEHYDADTGALTVHGANGRKDRLGYATNGAREALETWLRVRGDDPGPLFLPIDKGHTMHFRSLSDQAVFNMVRKRAKAASVVSFSPHDLRRTFISDLLDGGADIVSVQALAGHAQVTTTSRYDRRGDKVKRRAAELLHVPFSGK